MDTLKNGHPHNGTSAADRFAREIPWDVKPVSATTTSPEVKASEEIEVAPTDIVGSILNDHSATKNDLRRSGLYTDKGRGR